MGHYRIPYLEFGRHRFPSAINNKQPLPLGFHGLENYIERPNLDDIVVTNK